MAITTDRYAVTPAVESMILAAVGPTDTPQKGLVAVASQLGIVLDGPGLTTEAWLSPLGVVVLQGMIYSWRPWCRGCGCTDASACEEGCRWVESGPAVGDNVCSACALAPA